MQERAGLPPLPRKIIIAQILQITNRKVRANKMKRYGEDYKLDQETMDTIASYMDDEIREDLHGDLAPCEPEEFLIRYIERDPGFAELLENEFDIEI